MGFIFPYIYLFIYIKKSWGCVTLEIVQEVLNCYCAQTRTKYPFFIRTVCSIKMILPFLFLTPNLQTKLPWAFYWGYTVGHKVGIKWLFLTSSHEMIATMWLLGRESVYLLKPLLFSLYQAHHRPNASHTYSAAPPLHQESLTAAALCAKSYCTAA